MKIISDNHKLGQDKIAKVLCFPNTTLQRRRQAINMLSAYRIPSSSHKRRQKVSNTNLDENSQHEHDLKRPQLTSKDFKKHQKTSTAKKYRKVGLCPLHEISEYNDEYLVEILHSKNL